MKEMFGQPHPKYGYLCLGKNIDALTDAYCQDCEQCAECAEIALERVREVMREYEDLAQESRLEREARC